MTGSIWALEHAQDFVTVAVGVVLIVVALVVNVLSTPPSGTVVPPAPVLAEAAV